ncbi:MAG: enoyl-CoA hydratase-related protein [Pseudomonadales bacterium]
MTSCMVNIEAGVATVTLNRPEAYNTLDVELLDRLPGLLSQLADNSDVRCVVITGAGDKAFCAGGDISGLASGEGIEESQALTQKLEAWAQSARILHEMPKPTIAAVNGACAGAGMALALACDLRVGSENAHFTTAFINVAMSGDFGGSYFLTHLVGTAKARELYFLSERLSAVQALKLNLLNWLVPHSELETKTKQITDRIVAMPNLSYRNMKQNLNAAINQDLGSVIKLESKNMIETAMSKETQAAAIAFFNR